MKEDRFGISWPTHNGGQCYQSKGYWKGVVWDKDGRVIQPGVFVSYEEEAQCRRDERLARIEEKLDRLLASADTHPEGQDRETGLGS